MVEVALINMPFGAVHVPSLGLTQLKAALERDLEDVRVEIFYLNHDFADLFGLDLYRYLSDDSRTTVTGLTDWVFRPLAFPEAKDTTAEYISRYRHSLACRCEDGRRQDLDGSSTAPSLDPTKASAVPCCLGPDLLAEVLRLRESLGEALDDLIERHHLADYRLVGFTSMFDQTVASIAMARRLKARAPEVTTVMGGASCEPGLARVVAERVDAVDFVFAGPALRSFPEFVRRLASDERDKCHGMRGVYSQREPHRYQGSPETSVGEDDNINDRLALDYRGFLNSVGSRFPDIVPELFFETSRGCWWGERAHCTFCGINGMTMTFRAMSPENAIAQFRELFERYPDVPRFVAADNILDTRYYTAVFPFVRAPEGASIFYETRVTTDDEELSRLAQSGVTRIQAGVESLSTPTLGLMKKGASAFTNVRFLKQVLAHGIEVDWNLLTGFPMEDCAVYEQYVRIIPALVHLPAPVATFPVRFDRHSPYQKDPEAYGLDLRPVDFYALVYPFSDEELSEIAYFWSDHNFDNQYLFNLARWQRRIETAVDSWRVRYYQRDGLLKPELKLTANGDAVYDSRTGTALEHPVSPLGRRLLGLLDMPKSGRALREAAEADDDDVDAELAVLNESRLLLNEGHRMLSLVTDGALAVAAASGTAQGAGAPTSGETTGCVNPCSSCATGCCG